MDINTYISSDLLLRYCLGQVSLQEKQEVECMAHIYAAIKIELTSLQETLEKVALKLAVNPSRSLKGKIFEQISKIPQDEVESSNKLDEVPVLNIAEAKKSTRVVQLAAIGGIAASLAIGLFAVKQSNTIDRYAQKIEIFESKSVELNSSVSEAELRIRNQQELLTFMKSGATQKIVLNGTEISPNSQALVYWNIDEEKVLLDIAGLPDITSDQQYQLWALLDGVPIDLGVYNGSDDQLLQMKMVDKAQTFAITLEPKGGSVSPTMDQLYVLGNV